MSPLELPYYIRVSCCCCFDENFLFVMGARSNVANLVTLTSAMCRYLTRLQMVQFVCVFFHALLPLVLDCGYPKIVPLVRHFFLIKFISVFKFSQSANLSFEFYAQAMCANAVAFFVLFANFYFFAYVKKHQDVKKEAVTRKNV